MIFFEGIYSEYPTLSLSANRTASVRIVRVTEHAKMVPLSQ